MQRTSFAPPALSTDPRPTEREIYLKTPNLRHHERPLGGDDNG